MQETALDRSDSDKRVQCLIWVQTDDGAPNRTNSSISKLIDDYPSW